MSHKLSVKVITFLSVLSLLFVVSPLFAATAHANRTCCTDSGGGNASGNCDGCRGSGIETKNYGDSCGGAANCQVCSAQFPRSNECSTGSSGGGSGVNSDAMCQFLGITPTIANVRVGASTSFTLSVQQGTWDKIVINNSNPTIAVTNPVQYLGKAIGGAPKTYQYQYFTVTGLKIGTVAMSIDQYATYPGYMNLYCSRPFTVNVIAQSTPTPATPKPATPTPATPAPVTPAPLTPTACIPGARCDVVGNGRLQSGSYVRCSMPKAVNVPANTGMSYDLSCSYLNAAGSVVGNPILKTVVNPTTARAVFEVFPVNQSSGKYKCSFRTCTTVSGVKTCGAYGK